MTANELAAEIREYSHRAHLCRMAIAKSICDVGSYLYCRKCGETEMLTEQQVVDYLSSSSPEHCGQTMEIRR